MLWEPPDGKREGRGFVSTSVRAEKAPIILRFAPAAWVWPMTRMVAMPRNVATPSVTSEGPGRHLTLNVHLLNALPGAEGETARTTGHDAQK